jgi:hypothetical protein
MKQRHHSTERGQALIIIVFAMIGLIGLTALTVDGGYAYSDRRQAQNAADTAVLAGARAIIRGEDWKSAALAIASQNGYIDTDASAIASSAKVNVEAYACDDLDPDVDCGVYDGNSEYILVKITSVVDTFFAPVVGIQQLTNGVQAIAHVVPGDYVEMFDGNAVVGLAPHDCSAVRYQGNADTTITGGGIYVNSDCEETAFFNNSSSAQLTAPSLCTVGGITYEEGAVNIPSITEGCADLGFPPQNMVFPNPTCGSDLATVSGNTMEPGNYTGTFPPDDVTFLESGIYCVNGDFQLAATDVLTGIDVLIVVIDGDVTWNGGAEMHLDAPDTGAFAGLLLYLPMGDPIDYSHTVSINGNSGSTLTGTTLAPAADCIINGSGDLSEVDGQFVCYAVDLSGTADITISYNDQENWNAVEPPSLQLAE